MQFMTVMPLHQNCGKSTLCWQKGNGRKGIIIRKTHSTTNYIHMREHFQAMCGIWTKKTLDITHNLKWLVVRHATLYSNISKKFLLCVWKVGFYYLSKTIQTFQINDRRHFANDVMGKSKFWKTSELMKKGN